MEKSVFVDQEVAGLLLSVITEARKYAIVVTPYLDLDPWQHAKQAIELAVKNKVDMKFIVRFKQDWQEKDRESLLWLRDHKVKILTVENLHAKIYLNEKTTVISSMNLTESSARDSHEIAMMVRDTHDEQVIRDYINNALMKLAKLLPSATIDDGQVASRTREIPARHTVVAGVCIRCGQPIPLDTSKPLCEDDYDTWAEYENEDYQENYCHMCGRPSDVTYAKPLCLSCYQKSG